MSVSYMRSDLNFNSTIDLKKYFPDYIPPMSIQEQIKASEKRKVVEQLNKTLYAYYNAGYFSLTQQIYN